MNLQEFKVLSACILVALNLKSLLQPWYFLGLKVASPRDRYHFSLNQNMPRALYVTRKIQIIRFCILFE